MHSLWECKIVQPLCSFVVSHKLKYTVTISTIPLPDIHSREIKAYFHIKACTHMFTASFVIVKKGKGSNVHLQINGYTSCSMFVQWNIAK